MKRYDINSIKPFLGNTYKIKGKVDDLFFDSIKPVFETDENSLAWVSQNRKDKQELFNNCTAKIIICDDSINIPDSILLNKCIIIVNDPRLVFTKILNSLFLNDSEYCQLGAMHPTSIINPDAKIHDSVTIGPFNIIGKCEIGEGTYIGANNVIHDNVFIGRNVRINEFNLLGGAGLGFVREADGSLIKMAHIGRLIIEDDVEIFTHVNADRGTISDTIVKRGAKIDHHVHLGHNTVVGEHTLVVAHSVLCGGSMIGNRTWVGVGSYIKDAMKVGDDVTLGLGAVVTKNVPNGETWIGNPAKTLEEYKKIFKMLNAL
jgi:UDP-3-O-[3-hydroxymyristoyl] glucosamine N-acyltransferase